jgi:hypothetical protein
MSKIEYEGTKYKQFRAQWKISWSYSFSKTIAKNSSGNIYGIKIILI